MKPPESSSPAVREAGKPNSEVAGARGLSRSPATAQSRLPTEPSRSQSPGSDVEGVSPLWEPRGTAVPGAPTLVLPHPISQLTFSSCPGEPPTNLTRNSSNEEMNP